MGVAGYTLFRNDQRVASTSQRIDTYTYASLACGTSYVLGVRAYDAAGNRSARASIIVATTACPDTQPPTQPESVRQIAVTTSSITLGWAAASDDLGVIAYEILSDGSLAGSTATTQYGISGLACGTMHTLGVQALDAAGNRSTTATVLMATAPCPDSTAPSTPGQLVVRGSNQTSVTVGWSSSSDDVGVVGYEVYRDAAAVGSTATTGLHRLRARVRQQLSDRGRRVRCCRQPLRPICSDRLDAGLSVVHPHHLLPATRRHRLPRRA